MLQNEWWTTHNMHWRNFKNTKNVSLKSFFFFKSEEFIIILINNKFLKIKLYLEHTLKCQFELIFIFDYFYVINFYVFCILFTYLKTFIKSFSI